jgi:glycosyltransferase involved in cell wall biosynthesis
VKFSVLLPTRNGGALLHDCVKSVLDQPCEQMELIVSDNASEDSTGDVLASFDDPRLRVGRLDEAIPVTDNWNNALSESSGEYLLLIGDDDYLLPGYFEHANALLGEYGDPDCLSYEAYAFAYPETLPGSHEGHYADPLFPPDPALPPGGLIPASLRREFARDVFRFHYRFCLNLQTTLVSRRAMNRMRNGLFRPPFPDFYALIALMLLADRWAYSPERLVIVGVSPKSFGRTLHRGGQDAGIRAQGMSYLGISTDFEGQLPGNEMVNGTHLSLRELERDYGPELDGITVSRGDYVSHQVYNWFMRWRLGWLPGRELRRMLRLLSARDWAGMTVAVGRRLSPDLLRQRLRVNRDQPAEEFMPGMRPAPGIDDIAALARWLESNQAAGRPEA